MASINHQGQLSCAGVQTQGIIRAGQALYQMIYKALSIVSIFFLLTFNFSNNITKQNIFLLNKYLFFVPLLEN